MSRVRIYTKPGCVFSEKALLFLEDAGIPYDEIDIDDDDELRAEMVSGSGGDPSTPQIFIDGEHLGGYEDLIEEDHFGRLAARLATGLEQPPGVP